MYRPSFIRRARSLCLACATAMAAGVTPAAAQGDAPLTASGAAHELVATGTGEAKMTLDRGLLTLVVESRAVSAAGAASAHAARVQAVLARLRAMGVSSDRLSTTGVGISGGQWYNRQTGIDSVGFVSRTMIDVAVSGLDDPRRVDEASRLLEGAIAAGATRVDGVRLTASDVAGPRSAAIALAVSNACRDARSVARAGGGRVGPMLSAAVSEAGYRQPTYTRLAVTGVQVGFEGSTSTIAMSVTARWLLLPGSPASDAGASDDACGRDAPRGP